MYKIEVGDYDSNLDKLIQNIEMSGFHVDLTYLEAKMPNLGQEDLFFTDYSRGVSFDDISEGNYSYLTPEDAEKYLISPKCDKNSVWVHGKILDTCYDGLAHIIKS